MNRKQKAISKSLGAAFLLLSVIGLIVIFNLFKPQVIEENQLPTVGLAACMILGGLALIKFVKNRIVFFIGFGLFLVGLAVLFAWVGFRFEEENEFKAKMLVCII